MTLPPTARPARGVNVAVDPRADGHRQRVQVGEVPLVLAWGPQVRSARGWFKSVGRHSEYSIYAVRRCVGRVPEGVK